jgi:hypothetical protein
MCGQEVGNEHIVGAIERFLAYRMARAIVRVIHRVWVGSGDHQTRKPPRAIPRPKPRKALPAPTEPDTILWEPELNELVVDKRDGGIGRVRHWGCGKLVNGGYYVITKMTGDKDMNAPALEDLRPATPAEESQWGTPTAPLMLRCEECGDSTEIAETDVVARCHGCDTAYHRDLGGGWCVSVHDEEKICTCEDEPAGNIHDIQITSMTPQVMGQATLDVIAGIQERLASEKDEPEDDEIVAGGYGRVSCEDCTYTDSGDAICGEGMHDGQTYKIRSIEEDCTFGVIFDIEGTLRCPRDQVTPAEEPEDHDMHDGTDPGCLCGGDRVKLETCEGCPGYDRIGCSDEYVGQTMTFGFLHEEDVWESDGQHGMQFPDSAGPFATFRLHDSPGSQPCRCPVTQLSLVEPGDESDDEPDEPETILGFTVGKEYPILNEKPVKGSGWIDNGPVRIHTVAEYTAQHGGFPSMDRATHVPATQVGDVTLYLIHADALRPPPEEEEPEEEALVPLGEVCSLAQAEPWFGKEVNYQETHDTGEVLTVKITGWRDYGYWCWDVELPSGKSESCQTGDEMRGTDRIWVGEPEEEEELEDDDEVLHSGISVLEVDDEIVMDCQATCPDYDHVCRCRRKVDGQRVTIREFGKHQGDDVAYFRGKYAFGRCHLQDWRWAKEKEPVEDTPQQEAGSEWRPKVGDWVVGQQAGYSFDGTPLHVKSVSDGTAECTKQGESRAWTHLVKRLRPLGLSEVKTPEQAEQFFGKRIRAKIGEPAKVEETGILHAFKNGVLHFNLTGESGCGWWAYPRNAVLADAETEVATEPETPWQPVPGEWVWGRGNTRSGAGEPLKFVGMYEGISGCYKCKTADGEDTHVDAFSGDLIRPLALREVKTSEQAEQFRGRKANHATRPQTFTLKAWASGPWEADASESDRNYVLDPDLLTLED